MPGISKDLFPARITIGGETYPRGRIFVDTRGRAVVWVEEDGGAKKIAEAEVTEVSRIQGRTFSLTTADGEEWTATKSGSCGCGSPLRRISRSRAFQ